MRALVSFVFVPLALLALAGSQVLIAAHPTASTSHPSRTANHAARVLAQTENRHFKPKQPQPLSSARVLEEDTAPAAAAEDGSKLKAFLYPALGLAAGAGANALVHNTESMPAALGVGAAMGGTIGLLAARDDVKSLWNKAQGKKYILSNRNYGKCLVQFEALTAPGKCKLADSTRSVTTEYAHAWSAEVSQLSRAFKNEKARKEMLYAGLGVKKTVNTIMAHVINRAKSQIAYQCSKQQQQSPCQTSSVSETSTPPSLGLQRDCVQKIVNGYGSNLGLQGRQAQLVRVLGTADRSSLVGESPTLAAAVVICSRIASRASSHDFDQAIQSNIQRGEPCACASRDSCGEQVYDCLVDSYDLETISVDKDLEEEPSTGGGPTHPSKKEVSKETSAQEIVTGVTVVPVMTATIVMDDEIDWEAIPMSALKSKKLYKVLKEWEKTVWGSMDQSMQPKTKSHTGKTVKVLGHELETAHIRVITTKPLGSTEISFPKYTDNDRTTLLWAFEPDEFEDDLDMEVVTEPLTFDVSTDPSDASADYLTSVIDSVLDFLTKVVAKLPDEEGETNKKKIHSTIVDLFTGINSEEKKALQTTKLFWLGDDPSLKKKFFPQVTVTLSLNMVIDFFNELVKDKDKYYVNPALHDLSVKALEVINAKDELTKAEKGFYALLAINTKTTFVVRGQGTTRQKENQYIDMLLVDAKGFHNTMKSIYGLVDKDGVFNDDDKYVKLLLKQDTTALESDEQAELTEWLEEITRVMKFAQFDILAIYEKYMKRKKANQDPYTTINAGAITVKKLKKKVVDLVRDIPEKIKTIELEREEYDHFPTELAEKWEEAEYKPKYPKAGMMYMMRGFMRDYLAAVEMDRQSMFDEPEEWDGKTMETRARALVKEATEFIERDFQRPMMSDRSSASSIFSGPMDYEDYLKSIFSWGVKKDPSPNRKPDNDFGIGYIEDDSLEYGDAAFVSFEVRHLPQFQLDVLKDEILEPIQDLVVGLYENRKMTYASLDDIMKDLPGLPGLPDF